MTIRIMPLVSALNGDSVKIPDGAPVAGRTNRLQLDRVILAGGSVLCAGLAKSGAINGGVINVLTDGILDLDNWIHVTGSRTLQVGRTYRLSSQKGKLTTSGTGQVVGLAISGNQMSLQMGLVDKGSAESNSIDTSSFATVASLSAETAARASADSALLAQINALQAQIIALQTMTYASLGFTCGTVPIGNGLDSGNISGLGLSFTPSKVLLTVSKPAGGLNLWAEVSGTITSDGFSFTLSGLTDSAGYTLSYALSPQSSNISVPTVPTVNGVPMPTGSFPLLSGTSSGSITGLALPADPTDVFLTVRKPVGGIALFAVVVGVPTSDGFSFELNGMTDDVGYYLEYLIAPSSVFLIPNNADGGTVTGLDLTFIPSRVLLSVIAPAGGLQLYASLVGAPTSDGFRFSLSGITDSANYRLDYVLIA